MSIDEALINRLSTEAGRRLTQTARLGRRRALEVITRFEVTLTRDGVSTWAELFDRPPMLEEISARAGAGVFLVSVQMKRKSLRERFRLAIAAE